VVTLRNVSILTISSLGMLMAVGCASRHEAIPSSATMVAENQGRGHIDFVAPRDGQVYVEDHTAHKLLYSGEVREGQHLNVEPIKDRITVDEQMVRDQKIRDLDNVRVFFKGDRNADYASSRSRTIVNQPVQVVQPNEAQPASSSGDSQITVRQRGDKDAEIRVRPGPNADSKITVEPSQDGSKSKVTVENEPK
jgi:hypothetical protein